MNLWSRIKNDPPFFNCFKETLNAGLFGMFGGAFYPFLGIFLVHAGGNAIQLGILGCAPFVGNLAAPLWARFALRRKMVPVIVLFLLLARVLVLPIGFLTNTWLITILILAHFITGSVSNPAYYRLLQKIYPPHIRGRAMSIVRFVLGGTQTLTILAVGRFIDDYSGIMFLVGGIIGILALIPFLLIKEEDTDLSAIKEAGGKNKESFISALRLQLRETQGFGLFLIGFFLFEIGNFLPISVYPKFQVDILDMSSGDVALIGTLWNAAWCITYPLWGVLTDKLGPGPVIFLGFGLQALTPFAYAATDQFILLQMVALLSGAANSAIDVAWINTLMRMGETKVSATSSLHLQLSGLRGATLPILGSVLFQGGVTIFIVSSASIFLSLIPMALLIKKLNQLEKGYIRPAGKDLSA